MTYCDVYIGRLDDPRFSWVGGDWNGNVPTRLSPFFPPTFTGGYGAWSLFHQRIRDGRFKGRQTDWGGWVVPASKTEIEAFLREIYAGYVGRRKPAFTHLGRQLDELEEFVRNLEDDGELALVATEL